MELKLEDLAYQREAVDAVVRLFEGQPRNTFDMACHEGVRGNCLSIPSGQIRTNVLEILEGSGISEDSACLADALDFCVEMETGTGKTLVYLKTIYELFRQYGFTKFIILVPSVAIKEGVLATFESFAHQLANVYGFTPACFEYDSKRLNRVTTFVEEQHPQIMVTKPPLIAPVSRCTSSPNHVSHVRNSCQIQKRPKKRIWRHSMPTSAKRRPLSS